MGLVQLGDRRKHAQRAPHRPLRVIFVDRRDAEHGHDRIPDELVEGAADALDLTAQPAVEGAQHGPDILGIGPIGARREAHKITEQHRDDLALLALWLARHVGQRRPARPTEPELPGVFLPAVRAPAHGCSHGR
jgi:hypothetical protein